VILWKRRGKAGEDLDNNGGWAVQRGASRYRQTDEKVRRIKEAALRGDDREAILVEWGSNEKRGGGGAGGRGDKTFIRLRGKE